MINSYGIQEQRNYGKFSLLLSTARAW